MVSGAYLVCALLTFPLSAFVQEAIWDVSSDVRPLLLIHTLSVVAAWLFSWRFLLLALPGIIGATIGVTVVAPGMAPDYLPLIALTAVMAPFAFQTMKWAGLYEGPDSGIDTAPEDLREPKITPRSWRSVILGSLKTALGTYLLISLFIGMTEGTGLSTRAILLTTAVDVVTLVIVMTCVMMAFRWQRLS